MAPGPLFASNVAYGIKGGWKSGIKMAYGHTLVELPLVILIGIGAVSLGTFPQFREYVSILGAASLFVFAGLQIRSTYLGQTAKQRHSRGPFLAGVVLSGLNPFFIVWWLTIGVKLISDAIVLYSLIGIGLVFVFHIWMDYAWLGVVGLMSSRGSHIFSIRDYKIFMVALSVVLVYYGITFLLDALR
ncbi:MAG: LysE family transporter [Thaumarchaeota archaeon]|nr:LysE family transporter [Nitrososphaerota archaeon]